MKKGSFILFACSVVFAQLLLSDVIGIGYGTTYQQAKQDALSDLSQNIKSEVITIIKTHTNDNSSYTTSDIKVSSHLPILGAEFETVKKDKEIKIKAVLSKKTSANVYKNKLEQLLNQIKQTQKTIKQMSNEKRLHAYEHLFSLLEQYDKYNTVALVLGIKISKKPDIDKASIQIQLDKLKSKITTIDMGCEIFAKSFKQKNIFVYPPQLDDYLGVSEFGAVFAKTLQGKLKNAKKIQNADFILSGSYIPTNNALIINYQMLNTKTNKIVLSKTLKLQKQAYKGLKLKPKNIDFETLLKDGVALSNKLRVSIKTNKGDQNLLFRDKDEVELFVKLNKMGYIYIVGYTQNNKKRLSYLLELSDGDGEWKFIRFINADDANRWISLGSFEVEKPFGIESLQVIASNKPIKTLPYTNYDKDSGYYIISKDIKKALRITRGLKKKKSNKAEFSEDIITFTTMPK